MNEKFSLRQVAEVMAGKTGVTTDEIEKFLKELVSIINEGIAKDQVVKIKGIGVFKVKIVKARKSKNIQTKEDFIIPEHHKISFDPENALEELINKRFLFFTDVELKEESSLVTDIRFSGDGNEDEEEEPLTIDATPLPDDTEEPCPKEEIIEKKDMNQEEFMEEHYPMPPIPVRTPEKVVTDENAGQNDWFPEDKQPETIKDEKEEEQTQFFGDTVEEKDDEQTQFIGDAVEEKDEEQTQFFGDAVEEKDEEQTQFFGDAVEEKDEEQTMEEHYPMPPIPVRTPEKVVTDEKNAGQNDWYPEDEQPETIKEEKEDEQTQFISNTVIEREDEQIQFTGDTIEEKDEEQTMENYPMPPIPVRTPEKEVTDENAGQSDWFPEDKQPETIKEEKEDEQTQFISNTVIEREGEQTQFIGNTIEEKDEEQTQFISDTIEEKDEEQTQFIGDTIEEKDEEQTQFIGNTVEEKDEEQTQFIGNTVIEREDEQTQFIGDTVEETDEEQTQFTGDNIEEKDEEQTQFIGNTVEEEEKDDEQTQFITVTTKEEIPPVKSSGKKGTLPFGLTSPTLAAIVVVLVVVLGGAIWTFFSYSGTSGLFHRDKSGWISGNSFTLPGDSDALETIRNKAKIDSEMNASPETTAPADSLADGAAVTTPPAPETPATTPAKPESRTKKTTSPTGKKETNSGRTKTPSVAGTPAGSRTNTPATSSPSSGSVLASVSMEQGSRLTLLALKYYGDKIFWVYIYEYNKAKIGANPDYIPVGKQILIPAKEVYGIDANSVDSREKARLLQAKIKEGMQ